LVFATILHTDKSDYAFDWKMIARADDLCDLAEPDLPQILRCHSPATTHEMGIECKLVDLYELSTCVRRKSRYTKLFDHQEREAGEFFQQEFS
jgi:hypothetical protein